MLHKGDRFISQRSIDGDDSTRQRIKQELYSQPFISPEKKSKEEHEANDQDAQGQQPKEDTMQLEEENKRTYRALLQN